MNQSELERRLNEFLLLTPHQLKSIKEDPEATVLELLIVSIITHAINKGDQMRFNFLLDRLVGKVKDSVSMSGPDGGPIQIQNSLQNMSNAELLKLLPEAIEALKKGNTANE